MGIKRVQRAYTWPTLACGWPKCRPWACIIIAIYVILGCVIVVQLSLHTSTVLLYTTMIDEYQEQIQTHDYKCNKQIQQYNDECNGQIRHYESTIFDYRSGNFTIIALEPSNLQECFDTGWSIKIYNDSSMTTMQHTHKCICYGYRMYSVIHNYYHPLIAYIFTQDIEYTIVMLHSIFIEYYTSQRYCCKYCINGEQTREILRSNNIPFIYWHT